MATTSISYRRNITKSRAGHYRLTLIDKETLVKVTSTQKWSTADQAKREDEARLALQLAELAASGSVYVGESFNV